MIQFFLLVVYARPSGGGVWEIRMNSTVSFLIGVACTATQADIVFVVDSSGSIGFDNFEKVKVFIQGLINSLDIDPDLTRVGLMLFNDNQQWAFRLGQYDTKIENLKVFFLLLPQETFSYL